MEENNDRNPISLLAEKYHDDLKKIDSLGVVIVTDIEEMRLQELAMEYGLDEIVTRKTYIMIRGKVRRIINTKLEEFVRGRVADGKSYMDGHDNVVDLSKSSQIDKRPSENRQETSKVREGV